MYFQKVMSFSHVELYSRLYSSSLCAGFWWLQAADVYRIGFCALPVKGAKRMNLPLQPIDIHLYRFPSQYSIDLRNKQKK